MINDSLSINQHNPNAPSLALSLEGEVIGGGVISRQMNI
jgi:hypothetical protein